MPAGTLAQTPDEHIRGLIKSGFKKKKIFWGYKSEKIAHKKFPV